MVPYFSYHLSSGVWFVILCQEKTFPKQYIFCTESVQKFWVLFLFVYLFEAISSDPQGLFLVLHSGITLGSTQGT